MKKRKPKYKLIQSRAATMEDVNCAALRAIEYLVEQGVLQDDSSDCDSLYGKIIATIEQHYNYPDYGNYL